MTTGTSIVAEEMAAVPPSTLYHYTTQAGFVGIFESETLRASKIQHLNDSTEFRLAIDTALEIVQSRQSREKDPAKRDLLDQLFEDALDLGGVNVCVASLSAAEDQLSQWRAYGGGTGVAIGFDSPGLQRAAAKSRRFQLLRCVYEADRQRRLVSEVVSAALGEIDPVASWGPLHPKLGFEANLTVIAAIVKHPAFVEEVEWRLVSTTVPAGSLEFRASSSMVIPYCALKLRDSPRSPLPVTGVLVGPSPVQELAVDGACMLALKHGVVAKKVRPSEVPFRNW